MIESLVEKISTANKAYRLGNPIMSDFQYDKLIDELVSLDPSNPILKEIGFHLEDDGRKRKLPIEMASMNKVKNIDEVYDWIRLKGIKKSEIVIVTPKYDGLSFCVNEETKEAFTRGDGKVGQKSDEHYKLIQNKLFNTHDVQFTWGEVIMSKKTFSDKYSKDYANPRNLVAGLLNSKEITSPLQDLHYIKYGCQLKENSFQTKSEMLDFLNQNQEEKVPYIHIPIKDLNHQILVDLFNLWSEEFEIDGLIIEINSLELSESLGRETSTENPVWARAYKSPDFEQTIETNIIGISWNISKQGLLKPTIHVEPVKLDGVTISNVTGNNARFVKDNGLGVGAKILIKRSGFVIPKIVDVLEKVPFQMPDVPNIEWNDNGIELVTLQETDEQRFKQAVSFFEILEVDNVGEGVVRQLWDAGFNSIKSILNLTPETLSKLEGFGDRKSQIVFNSIQSKIKEVELSKLQHATGIFTGLGSKKLVLLEGFKEKPTIEKVMSIDGFAEISAKTYVENWDKFYQFIQDLPITIKERNNSDNMSNELEGLVFVFTGIRLKKEEELILSKGGKVGGSVTKMTTHLVCKDPNSGSSKLEKAQKMGVKIMSVEDFLEFLY